MEREIKTVPDLLMAYADSELDVALAEQALAAKKARNEGLARSLCGLLANHYPSGVEASGRVYRLSEGVLAVVPAPVVASAATLPDAVAAYLEDLLGL